MCAAPHTAWPLPALQEDAHFYWMTVRETLRFAAATRLPAALGAAAQQAAVERIIRRLGLGKAADTLVGGGLVRGVSGGERKRTSIAVELLSNPSLIFLDEPTSGAPAAAGLAAVRQPPRARGCMGRIGLAAVGARRVAAGPLARCCCGGLTFARRGAQCWRRCSAAVLECLLLSTA